MLFQEEEWPSDDSEDDDYDPDRIECSLSGNMSTSESDGSQYSSSLSLEYEDGIFGGRGNRSFDETLALIGVDSDEISNGEVVSHPRQRASVDYIKLYNVRNQASFYTAILLEK